MPIYHATSAQVLPAQAELGRVWVERDNPHQSQRNVVSNHHGHPVISEGSARRGDLLCERRSVEKALQRRVHVARVAQVVEPRDAPRRRRRREDGRAAPHRRRLGGGGGAAGGGSRRCCRFKIEVADQFFDVFTKLSMYSAGRPIIRKDSKIRIWVVPPVCLGSR